MKKLLLLSALLLLFSCRSRIVGGHAGSYVSYYIGESVGAFVSDNERRVHCIEDGVHRSVYTSGCGGYWDDGNRCTYWYFEDGKLVRFDGGEYVPDIVIKNGW